MPRLLDPSTLPRSVGQASQAVLLGAPFKRLVATPQTGMRPDGTLPDELEGQLGQAFDNLGVLLAAAGLEWRDLVRLALHTRVAGAAEVCRSIRDRKIAPARPAFAYREVSGFADPRCLVEIEAEAVRES